MLQDLKRLLILANQFIILAFYIKLMKKNLAVLLVTSLLFYSLNEVYAQINPERQWTAYRGRFSSGVLDNANLPESFDFTKMLNVRWKTEIPGLGLSSPVIWDNKIFITSAISQSDREGFKPGLYGDITPVSDSSMHEWKVFCIDKCNRISFKS